MERTKVVEDKVVWMNRGGGSFRMGNKQLIKPGQRFEAYLEDIPRAFRDVIVPANEVAAKAVKKEAEKVVEIVVHPEFEVRERATGTGYDVFDQNGKKRNTKLLTFAQAEDLVEALKS